MFIFNQQLSILRLWTSSTFSLEIDGTKWSGEVSEELGNTDGINLSGLVYIIVVPGIFVSKCQEFISLFFALSKVSAKNFLSSLFSRVFSQIEFTVWLWVGTFTIHTFEGIIGDHILSEFINWIRVKSDITGESLWDASIIWLEETSILINSSWESVQRWFPSIESSKIFNNLFSRCLDKTLFIKFILVRLESQRLGWGCNKS